MARSRHLLVSLCMCVRECVYVCVCTRVYVGGSNVECRVGVEEASSSLFEEEKSLLNKQTRPIKEEKRPVKGSRRGIF